MGVEGITALVTGGGGFCGRRLVEFLAERGASRVISLDLAFPRGPVSSPVVEEFVCDLTRPEQWRDKFRGVDCVWHIAALVGPFHPRHRYLEVNYEATVAVIEACREFGVRKLVFSSSPSTRFDGRDIAGLSEDQLTMPAPGKFLEPYAETKAMGERAVTEACSEALMTVSVAPHQVYGPYDPIFVPNLVSACLDGKLFIFGDGENEISVVHVDNYAHGLVLAFDALYPGSPSLGKFYIVTDGGKYKLWKMIDEAAMALGAEKSLFDKWKIPRWILYIVAHAGMVVASLLGGRSWKLTPFVVRMMTIDRWFVIDAARRDLHYEPLIPFETAWPQTIQWFKENPEWLRIHSEKTAKNQVFSKKTV